MQKPDIVILAAGFSSRMKRSKTEIKINNKTILEIIIKTIYDICDNIIIVTGHFHQSQKKILSHIKRVNVVYNENYQAGMFSSVKKGIHNVKQNRFFLLPADIPFVQISTFKKMLKLKQQIVIPVFNERKGHPVLINSELIPEILSERTDSNLRDFIQKTGFSLVNVDDEYILKDLDIPQDIYKLKKESEYNG